MLEDLTIDARSESVASASTVIKNAEHEDRSVGATIADSRSMTALLPIMGVVLVAFLVIGLALPVLPLHVHQDLGLDGRNLRQAPRQQRRERRLNWRRMTTSPAASIP